MPKNHIFRFRVSKQQYEKICHDAKSHGYHYTACYIRDLLLGRNLMIEHKIIETNKITKEILEMIEHEIKKRNSRMD